MFHQEYHTFCLGDEMPEISFHPETSVLPLQDDEFGNSDYLFNIWPLDDTLEEVLDKDQSCPLQARDTTEQQLAYEKDAIDPDQRKGVAPELHAKEKPNIECRKEIACPTCKKSFTSFTRLFNHMQIHGGKLQCGICDKVFAKRSHLYVHIQRHMKIRSHHCEECSFSSTDKHDLIVHISRHKNERKYECAHCNKRFFRRVELNYHEKCVHLCTNIKQCKLCKFTTHSRNILNHHNINKHQSKQTFRCHRCRAVFQHKNSLVVHIRTHTGARPFSCVRCKKLFKSKSELTSHYKSHKVPSDTCTVCSRRFSRRSNLLQHMVIHTKKKHHLCSFCPYSSFWKSTLERHVKTVHKTAALKLNNANNITRLELNEITVPEKEREHPSIDESKKLQVSNDDFSDLYKKKRYGSHREAYSCQWCCKVFKRKSELNSHLFVHKKNTFECDTCNKKFKTKSNLSRHSISHTGLKPHSCKFCSYASNLKTSLTRHLLSKHGSQNVV